MTGTGRQHGALRPDWGDGWADLACDECGATWVGPLDEPCAWCEVALERMRAWQADKVLTAPDVDADDARRPAVLRAWGERLAVAVKAEIVTEAQAKRVLVREMKAVA